MSYVKIAVGGAHSTGKTTFLRQLEAALYSRKVSCKVVGDLAVKCPLPILKEHTVESTLWIVATGIAEEIAAAYKSQVVLVDRPVVDAWAYLMAGKNGATASLTSPTAMTLQNAIREWLPTYRVIYQSALDENVPIQDDKNRLLDPSYRAEVARQMELAYKGFKVPSRTLSLDNADSEIDSALREIDHE
jgi:nicotinamide riboside kinase